MVENWFEKNTIRIEPQDITVSLPHYQQLTYSSCGAAACRSLGSYYGVGPKTEAGWRKYLSTHEGGTKPISIANQLRRLGLRVRPKKNTSLEELFCSLDAGIPVMCPIQAYGSPYWYRTVWCGHWVTAIGYNDKYVFFEDSWVKRRRSFLTHAKMEQRWFDTDWDGRNYPRLSMTIVGDEVKRRFNLRVAQRIW